MSTQVIASIELNHAVLCVACQCISDSPGERCRVCDGVGGLLSLANVLEGRQRPQDRQMYPRDHKEADLRSSAILAAVRMGL